MMVTSFFSFSVAEAAGSYEGREIKHLCYLMSHVPNSIDRTMVPTLA